MPKIIVTSRYIKPNAHKEDSDMIAAEIAASATECAIMAEFLTRCLGVKNDRYKVLKAAVCGLLLFLNIIICPLLTDAEMVSVAIMLVIEMAYSVLFLEGKIFKKIFVAQCAQGNLATEY